MAADDSTFRLKRISYNGRDVPVLMQNENGPCPLLGLSKQPIRFISVDFPEPDGPMIATYSPFSITREISRRAYTISSPIG